MMTLKRNSKASALTSDLCLRLPLTNVSLHSIFYQTRTGIITRGIISSNPDGSHNTTAGSSSASSASSAGDDNPATTTATYSLNFATVNSLQLGASGTKLAAAWSNGASWYLYQNSSDQPYSTQIQFSGVTRNGANLLSGWSDPVPDNYG